jgi:gluconate 2-dehydrogenase alpha chain/gluconate 2-dehydrogenase gamma chain
MAFDVSRRQVLGVFAGSSLALAFDLPHLCAHAAQIADGKSPYFFLTSDEATVLKVLCDRIIPKDEYPSASEAGVLDFIDLQLATDWGQGRQFYMQGPFDPSAPKNFGYQQADPPAGFMRKALAQLIGGDANAWSKKSDKEVDDLLGQWHEGKGKIGDLSGEAFFLLLRDLTSQGYFADPAYNGNRDCVGWRMIGFPGANAYYLTEVDRYNMVYDRAPSGIAHSPGLGTAPFTPNTVRSSSGEAINARG